MLLVQFENLDADEETDCRTVGASWVTNSQNVGVQDYLRIIAEH
jgi:hypothetical protein